MAKRQFGVMYSYVEIAMDPLDLASKYDLLGYAPQT